MRLFLAAVVLAAAVSGAVGLDDYRTSSTERVCAYSRFPGQTCAQARKSGVMFTPIGEVRRGETRRADGTTLRTETWKPQWAFPLSLFVGIAGAGLAASIAIPRRGSR